MSRRVESTKDAQDCSYGLLRNKDTESHQLLKEYSTIAAVFISEAVQNEEQSFLLHRNTFTVPRLDR